MYIGLSPAKFDESGTPIELTGGLLPENQRTYGTIPTIPGTNIPVNVQPAQSQLTNMLVYLGIAAAVILLLRSK
jgi:hypothetical protein